MTQKAAGLTRIVLRGAETYTCAAFPTTTISRGEAVEIADPAIADLLLNEVYTDYRGNTRRMFTLDVPDGQVPIPDVDSDDLVEEEPPKEIPLQELSAAAKVSRRRAAGR